MTATIEAEVADEEHEIASQAGSQAEPAIQYEVESPYSAEVDPVTGVYRLKTKSDDIESGAGDSNSKAMSAEEPVSVAVQSEALSDYTPNFTLQREEVSQLTLPAFQADTQSESQEEGQE
ncbi:MAG: hypothetical protein BWY75_01926 [bacterium ADurb.Bin425]|nr:MAG: hypothetical protein BWY75_01926 [bacterium ADurb.Bin425]